MPLFHITAKHDGSTCAYKREFGKGFMECHSKKEALEAEFGVKVLSNVYDLVGHSFFFVVEATDHMKLSEFIFAWSGHQFMRQDFDVRPVVEMEAFVRKASLVSDE